MISYLEKGENVEKCEIFINFSFLSKILSGFCYTRLPRGNQVGDLPRALHGIGRACIRSVLAAIGDFTCKMFYAVIILLDILYIRKRQSMLFFVSFLKLRSLFVLCL